MRAGQYDSLSTDAQIAQIFYEFNKHVAPLSIFQDLAQKDLHPANPQSLNINKHAFQNCPSG